MGEAVDSERTLEPIDEVARRFGIRASTIRYYEDRGLLQPAARRAGRRWYGQAELRRLAIIRYWQQSGLMSLDNIALILAGPDDSEKWHQLIDQQVGSLTAQIQQMETAKDFLEHVAYHHNSAPDGCHHYEALIWGRQPPSSDEPEGRSVLEGLPVLGQTDAARASHHHRCCPDIAPDEGGTSWPGTVLSSVHFDVMTMR